MVKKYQALIKKHTNLIDNIYSIEFAPLGRKFKYLPGQFLHLAIDNYDGIGQWPESRCFSMQTSPSYSNIIITYAAKGKFTRRMSQELVSGDKVWLKLPYGDLFENDHTKNNIIFIAGGTGVTPFLSLFSDTSFVDYLNPHLFFGIRERKYHLYESEFEKAKKINPELNIKMYFENENGRPDIDEIFKAKEEHSSFFVSGSPAMIEYYLDALCDIGVLRDMIFTDKWE